MFRRFMIVCWVLFTIGMVTGVVGFAGYQYYDPIVKETAETHTFEKSGNKLVYYDQELSDRLDICEGIMVAGFVWAAVILLWIIVYHTAYWIWMGRKEQ